MFEENPTYFRRVDQFFLPKPFNAAPVGLFTSTDDIVQTRTKEAKRSVR